MVQKYTKENDRIEKERKKAENPDSVKESEYLGNVGDRITFTATARLISSYEGEYGWSGLYKFVDDDGNIIMWSTNKELDNSKYTITATIKNLQEYRGEKQTVVTRGKIIKAESLCDDMTKEELNEATTAEERKLVNKLKKCLNEISTKRYQDTDIKEIRDTIFKDTGLQSYIDQVKGWDKTDTSYLKQYKMTTEIEGKTYLFDVDLIADDEFNVHEVLAYNVYK